MELNNYTEFDSTWPSDNESPHVEMRMYKDTILRLPPQGFERWVSIHSLEGYEKFYEPFAGSNDGEVERLIACGDAMWHNIHGVQMSFLKGYMTSGPIGFSCDLTKISPKATEEIKQFIKDVKNNRSFWMNTVARILCDTDSVTAFQYSDMNFEKVVVQTFVHQAQQQNFIIIPELDSNKKYSVNGEIRTGKEIMDEGIFVETPEWRDSWHHMFETVLTEVK